VTDVHQQQYDNFHDPAKLIWRMLTSGNSIAIDTLWRAGLGVLTTPIDTMLQRNERSLFHKQAEADLPCVFIVGAPRSGTTLVYQVLTHVLHVSYFTNVTAMFPRSPITATRYFQSLGLKGRKSFRNYYGNTAGLQSPNDGFGVWNRWLGKDRYVARKSLEEHDIEAMRNFFKAWHAVLNLPFLNKNNRNLDCLSLLAESLPGARFIVVRRNPILVVQSILESRKIVHGDATRAWGLMSETLPEFSTPIEILERICDQVVRIEQRLQDQLREIEENRWHAVWYEDFCRDPADTARRIAHDWIGPPALNASALDDLSVLCASSTVTLDVSAFEVCRQRLLKGYAALPSSLHIQQRIEEVERI